jgi:hypothetical protein
MRGSGAADHTDDTVAQRKEQMKTRENDFRTFQLLLAVLYGFL